MKWKIAMISEHASPLAVLGGVDSGGQNVYVAQVARHLAAMGHQVDVFTRRDRDDLPEIFEWEKGIRVIHVPAGPAEFVRKEDLFDLMPEFIDYLKEFFCNQKEPYHLIHAHFWMSGMAAIELKKLLGIPFLVTFHALGKVRRKYQKEQDGFPDARFKIEEEIVAAADRIIAECPQDEEDLIDMYNAYPDQISVIPCGFDATEISPIPKADARAYLGLPVDEHIILQLGRMVPRKGVDNVVRAVSRLVNRYEIPARLLIVGGDSDIPDKKITPEIGRLEKIAKDEGLTDSVTFVGRRSRDILRYYYSAADVFVSTPWYEPFGITPVEAMACGTPVIGSNVGGIKYTVASGQTGYLVEPNEPDALAERLASLLRNPERLEKFSQQAVERANQYFTWDQVTRSLLHVYGEVIGQVGKVRPEILSQTDLISHVFDEAIESMRKSQELLTQPIMDAVQVLIDGFSSGKKVLVCGNGGSAADSQHFAAELVGRFKKPGRAALPVLSLTADQAILTAWANDESYEDVFARQVMAYGQPGDTLVGISTSGQSRNLIEAFKTARERKMNCIALLGGDGGYLYALADIPIVVPAGETERIQEVHIVVLHLISQLVEDQLFSSDLREQPTFQPVHVDWNVGMSLFDGKVEERNGKNGHKSKGGNHGRIAG